MFIKSNAHIRIVLNQQESYDIPNNFVGEVPEKVAEHPYFKACCADGSIVTYVKDIKPTNKDLEASDKAAKELQRKADEASKKAAEVDATKEATRIKAEKEADEKGLDEVAKKKYVNKKVRAVEG